MTRAFGLPPKTGPNAVNPASGNNRRPHGGSRTRFVGTGHHGLRLSAGLPEDHPAILEARTLFPSTVVSAADAPRVLISGMNNAKIGRLIEKGPWTGFPVFTLTLEERATCPASCDLWRECYGNALHWSRRHKPGAALVTALDVEIDALARRCPDGFAVRLHILGDFYSLDYVAAWAHWMRNIPQLHVWGYTARPIESDIGGAIAALNKGRPDRWRIRFSVRPETPIAPMQVTTIWRQPDAPKQPEGAVCPQQFDKTATCGTCGLCWAPGNDASRIAFVGHGMSSRKKKP